MLGVSDAALPRDLDGGGPCPVRPLGPPPAGSPRRLAALTGSIPVAGTTHNVRTTRAGGFLDKVRHSRTV